MIKQFLPFLLTAIILAGCTAGNHNYSEFKSHRQHDNNARILNENEGGFYQRDLEDQDYTTNLNPNFIDLTEDRPDIGDDQEKIVQVIQQYTEFTPGAVIVNGRDAYVTVHTTKHYKGKERKEVKKDLNRRLMKAMPRYDIHLRIHDGD
ncbi:hypothetical protein IM538_22685 [Cytobacillus suaedae]|nr:hypothetical protein IM538_22685 [Cytobacillus suaedae]